MSSSWLDADWIEKIVEVNETVRQMNVEEDVRLRNSDEYVEYFNLGIEWWMETAGWAGVTDANC